ncbi:glycosyltransferase family 2 protein [bacterium]|nr:glycosyltransferase family 2 protein [bacterium]
MTTVTIGLLNYNTAGETEQALRTLPAAAGGVDARIVVIDNASSDDSLARLAAWQKQAGPGGAFPVFDLIALPANLGFAGAFNRLFTYAISEFYLLLNSDILLPPGSVAEMIDSMRQRPRAGLAGVALRREDGSAQSSFGAYPTLASELLNRSLYQKMAMAQARGAREPFAVECIVGAVMLVRREAYEQVGGLDERFFFFLEETDWCKRMTMTGWLVLHLPGIEVVHLQGRAANRRPVRARIEFHRSRIIYFMKHHGPVSTFVLIAGTAVRLMVNMLAQLVLTLVTLGLWRTARHRLIMYATLLAWYFCGRPDGWGLRK